MPFSTLPDSSNLALRTIAMPKDSNPSGDIFGGWLVSQMDLAGGLIARRYTKGRVTTVAIKEVVFHSPVKIGDEVSCYVTIEKIGHTSLTLQMEVWVLSTQRENIEKVTEGTFVFVAIDEKGHPRPVESNFQ